MLELGNIFKTSSFCECIYRGKVGPVVIVSNDQAYDKVFYFIKNVVQIVVGFVEGNHVGYVSAVSVGETGILGIGTRGATGG